MSTRCANWVCRACLVLLGVALLWLAATVPLAPPSFRNAWGWAHEGVSEFSTSPPVRQMVGPLSQDMFVPILRAALVTIWITWALLVAGTAARGCISMRTALYAAGVVVGLVVVFFPPSLSGDVFGYVAYGRLPGLHGMNPYMHGRQALAAAHDPSAAFLVWDTPLPYGPVWVMMASAVGALSPVIGLWGELLAYKAIAGASVLLGALAAGRLAKLRRSSCAAATIAIALNPLLVIEGPGSGHNDGLMAAAMIWAGLLSARRQPFASALALGLAVAIKPIALAAVPLLAAEQWLRDSGGHRFVRTGASLMLALLPTLVLSFLFGGPALLLQAVVVRATSHSGHPHWVIGTVFIGAALLSLWQLRREVTYGTAAAWLDAWVPVALAIALVAMPVSFPWYLSWALMPALTQPDRRHVSAITTASFVAFLLMWRYTTPI